MFQKQLAEAANTTLSCHQTIGRLEPFSVGAMGQFPYYWQNPTNLRFNSKSYSWISASLTADTMPIQLAENFNNLDNQALASISYVQSQVDSVGLAQNLSGFQFRTDPRVDFRHNGPFAFLTGVAISKHPALQVDVKGKHNSGQKIMFERLEFELL
jgi:hypothetical protein